MARLFAVATTKRNDENEERKEMESVQRKEKNEGTQRGGGGEGCVIENKSLTFD